MNKITRSQPDANVPENLLVTPLFALFLINAMQVGVGILGFESYIAKDAGYDSWLSILIAGAGIHLLLWMIYQILHDTNGDIVSVHREVFGKYLGGFLSFIFSIYLFLLSLVVFRTFIEVIQVWIFPRLQLWFFTAVTLLLIFYLVHGGFRLITGLCVISVLLTLPLLLLKFFPIQAGVVTNLYPHIDHSILELLKAAKTSVLGFLGIELLFVFYPFIKNPNNSKKWAHYGVFLTICIYMVSALASFIYFSEKQLEQVTWATISLWKIVEFPFIERFEYIGVAIWLYVVIPNICLALWAASRIPKRIFKVKQIYAVACYCVLLYIGSILLNERRELEFLNTFANWIGFYILMYIPVLFLLKKLRGIRRKADE
ncbi:GerAB/ArcD/ProY family transporter [Thalassobacillus pellis]|uniref:GerAB/ArcD/ProY family transporter n=1 Tax=Thalassobacillus pellis TaxID=748008 RepID=UPI00196049C5|nr:GerAB/ArcD/ProY family transporter [Thalassobacillus pellis]MBM7553611.1 spore germination protein (amino acid permease) [Thalassobacillus pellis]